MNNLVFQDAEHITMRIGEIKGEALDGEPVVLFGTAEGCKNPFSITLTRESAKVIRAGIDKFFEEIGDV